ETSLPGATTGLPVEDRAVPGLPGRADRRPYLVLQGRVEQQVPRALSQAVKARPAPKQQQRVVPVPKRSVLRCEEAGQNLAINRSKHGLIGERSDIRKACTAAEDEMAAGAVQIDAEPIAQRLKQTGCDWHARDLECRNWQTQKPPKMRVVGVRCDPVTGRHPGRGQHTEAQRSEKCRCRPWPAA